MPRITVREKDLSWYYRQRSSGVLTVFMPIVAEFGPHSPVYVNQDNFKRVFGDKPVLSDDISYHIAESLVKSGITVLGLRVRLHNEESASYTPEGSDITVKAKYPGTYGNKLKIKTVQIVGGYRVFVYNSSGQILEDFTVNFEDHNRGDYYETVNEETSYVSFTVSYPEEGDPVLTLPTYRSPVEGEMVDFYGTLVDLKGGSNGELAGGGGTQERLMSHFLLTLDVGELEDELSDPLMHHFDVAISGGINYYNEVGFYTQKFVIEDRDQLEYTLPEGHCPGQVALFVNQRLHIDQVSNEYFTYDDNCMGDRTGRITISSSLGLVEGDIVYITYHHLDESSNPTVMSRIDDEMIKLVETRGNSIYLVDGDRGFSAWDFYAYTSLPSEDQDHESSSGFNTSFAAAYGPWCNSVLISNGTVRSLPGSYNLLVGWAQSISKGNPVWLAPSGVKRATLSTVKSAEYPVGSAVLDLWQGMSNPQPPMLQISGELPHKINPIINLKQYGYVIYGNSTLLKTQLDGSTSMLQSFSTRVLVNMIKTKAYDTSLSLQFDQIDDDIFVEFKILLGEFMDQLRYGGALHDYEIVADYSNLNLGDLSSRTIPVTIRISPNPAVENFEINLEITQAGVTFGSDTAPLED